MENEEKTRTGEKETEKISDKRKEAGKYKKKSEKKRKEKGDESVLSEEIVTTENGKKKKFGKKQAIILAVTASVLVVAMTVGLCLYYFVFNKGVDYYEYFNNFKSEEVTSAVCTASLSQDTYVNSYDPTEKIFITARKYVISDGSTVERYGFASAEEEYCPPIYSAVVQTYGDYAIVAKPINETSGTGNYIDFIRYRGEEGTPYSLMGGKELYYTEGYKQIEILGEYAVVYGSIDYTLSQPTYSVFYDYKSGAELLEKFRVRAAYDSSAGTAYTYILCDNYLAAYSTDRAYFYDTTTDPVRGYLEPARQGEYVAFSEMTDSLSSFSRELFVAYLGNGWFVRSAMLSKYEPFNGFNLRLPGIDETMAQYARTKTDFYNIKTGKTSSANDIFCVAGVANEYTYDYYNQQSYMLGSLQVYDKETDTYEYNLPFANPAAMIKKGYSIVYYYYLPYLEDYASDQTTFVGYTGETTYCIFDENLKRIQPENALMPTAYIDGVGIQTSDPIYSETTGTAYAYNRYMESTVLATFSQGKATYIPYYATKEGCIINGTLKTGTGEAGQFYGAVTPDGMRITDFVYDELTYFSGGYAIGAKVSDGVKKYYRIDEKGKETELGGVVVLFQGTYTYKDGEKVGLKNYAGDIIIEPVEGTINVSDNPMNEDGSAMESYALVTVGNAAKIYKLNRE